MLCDGTSGISLSKVLHEHVFIFAATTRCALRGNCDVFAPPTPSSQPSDPACFRKRSISLSMSFLYTSAIATYMGTLFFNALPTLYAIPHRCLCVVLQISKVCSCANQKRRSNSNDRTVWGSNCGCKMCSRVEIFREISILELHCAIYFTIPSSRSLQCINAD